MCTSSPLHNVLATCLWRSDGNFEFLLLGQITLAKFDPILSTPTERAGLNCYWKSDSQHLKAAPRITGTVLLFKKTKVSICSTSGVAHFHEGKSDVLMQSRKNSPC